MPTKRLFRVIAPKWVAGFETHGDKVVRAAPILRWTLSGTLRFALHWCNYKGWKLEEVPLQ